MKKIYHVTETPMTRDGDYDNNRQIKFYFSTKRRALECEADLKRVAKAEKYSIDTFIDWSFIDSYRPSVYLKRGAK